MKFLWTDSIILTLTAATWLQTTDENYNTGLLKVFNDLIGVSGLYVIRHMKNNIELNSRVRVRGWN